MMIFFIIQLLFPKDLKINPSIIIEYKDCCETFSNGNICNTINVIIYHVYNEQYKSWSKNNESNFVNIYYKSEFIKDDYVWAEKFKVNINDINNIEYILKEKYPEYFI